MAKQKKYKKPSAKTVQQPLQFGKTKRLNLCKFYSHLIQKLPKKISSKLENIQCFTIDMILENIDQKKQVDQTVIDQKDQGSNEILEQMKILIQEQKQRMNILKIKSQQEIMTAEQIQQQVNEQLQKRKNEGNYRKDSNMNENCISDNQLEAGFNLNQDWGFADDIPSSKILLPPVRDQNYSNMEQKQNNYIDFFLY